MKGAMIAAKKPFCLEEATIDEMHRAIQSGEITVVEIVQHYIARARAYNGVSSVLVTEHGDPVPPTTGDLTGPFCTRRFERNCLGKELGSCRRRGSALSRS